MVKEIRLTQDKVALVDDEDYESLAQHKWQAGKGKTCFYALRHIWNVRGVRTTIRLHREIMDPPSGMQIDHKDMNGLNNQRANLRICTGAQNQQNRKPRANTSSQYKGVTWRKDRKKWLAQIGFEGRNKSLGCFDNERDAGMAYDKAARRQFGEFARTNF